MSTTITIQGNITKEPVLRTTGSGTPTCTLSVAVNRKVPARKEPGFVESVSFFSVVAYQQLAVNACETLRRGSRVVVTGRLDQRSWETAEGEKRSSYELVADDIGASLRWATGRFTKTMSGTAAPVVVGLPPLPSETLRAGNPGQAADASPA